MREKIDVFEYAPQILRVLKPGVLLNVAVEGKVNPMTIGWGMLGIEWGKPIFICYVRSGRYTHELLENTDNFTVSVPFGDADARARARQITAFCGCNSGRDVDKVAELGLTLVEGEHVDAPAIKELPLTLECRIVYRRDQDVALLPDEMRERNYPQDVSWSASGATRDAHTEYYGEIVAAYIAE